MESLKISSKEEIVRTALQRNKQQYNQCNFSLWISPTIKDEEIQILSPNDLAGNRLKLTDGKNQSHYRTKQIKAEVQYMKDKEKT